MLTNEQFGKLVGCHHSMASRLRHGQRVPSMALVQRIADALDYPVEKLVRASTLGAEQFGKELARAERLHATGVAAA